MAFQRARTTEQFNSRREEIINACDELYARSNFESVNIKAIAELTSFTRPSIYNYFKTKEEIFLALLQREYHDWHDEVAKFIATHEQLSKEDFCKMLTESMVKREKMLRLFSIHLTAIENNCSLEKLIAFKKDSAIVFDIFNTAIQKFFPNTPVKDQNLFRSEFFIYVLGVYPFTHLSKKQRRAMLCARVIFDQNDFYKLCYHGILLLAKNLRT